MTTSTLDTSYIFALTPRDVLIFSSSSMGQISFFAVQVATHQLKINQLLKPEFQKILTVRGTGGLTGFHTAVHKVYDELVRKLCNTRLNEFITSHQHSFARQKDNLRAKRKAQHTRCNIVARNTLLQQCCTMYVKKTVTSNTLQHVARCCTE